MNGEIINFLERYTKSGEPAKNLTRFSILMDKLGNPQNYLKFIHVAGTNGKGSTVRMLANSFILAGYKTGEFTSPFIFRYNDRIKINNADIPDEDLLRIIRSIEPALNGDLAGYSQFEITNAIAFIWFAEQKCDIVVLETGIGGLCDSTNIIRDNVCSVITSVSYDHTAVLGNTLEEIAFQKAGIIKDYCPVTLYPDNPEAVNRVAAKYAAIHGSKLIIPDLKKLKVLRTGTDGCVFSYKLKDYATAMPGTHQILNAVTAIEAAWAAKAKFRRLTDKKVFEGIATAVMPLRCQIVREKAPMIINDGAHNPDGMRVLAEFISTLPHYPKVMICGMSADKDWQTALSYISPLIDKAFCIDGFCPKTVFAPRLAERFADAECVSLSEVYHRAYSYAGDKGLLLIAGSLYIPSALNKFSK